MVAAAVNPGTFQNHVQAYPALPCITLARLTHCNRRQHIELKCCSMTPHNAFSSEQLCLTDEADDGLQN